MVDLERLEVLIGKENLIKIKNKNVLVCGVGGVGGFVAEALARSGIGKMTLIDYDTIEASNINRQIIANKKNIGESKVKVIKKRIEEISDCEVSIEEKYIDDEYSVDDCYDYVVDCIDTLTSKFHLIKECHMKNIPIISSLGSAKRIKVENIKYTTLDKTKNDPLAKAFRSLIKKENYKKKIDVVYVDSPVIKTVNAELGSSIFVVGSVGLYIASIVFEKLLNSTK